MRAADHGGQQLQPLQKKHVDGRPSPLLSGLFETECRKVLLHEALRPSGGRETRF
jgi:hypothetical protein